MIQAPPRGRKRLKNSAQALRPPFRTALIVASSLPGVAHHVGIGEIHDDGVEIAFFDRVNHGVGDARGGHFRLQVVGGHFGRRHQDALLAGERLFHAAIEEISDVRVFFGFGDAQIA